MRKRDTANMLLRILILYLLYTLYFILYTWYFKFFLPLIFPPINHFKNLVSNEGKAQDSQVTCPIDLGLETRCHVVTNPGELGLGRRSQLFDSTWKKKSQEIKGRFFLRKYDVFFSLPKKYAENYPEKEILKYDWLLNLNRHWTPWNHAIWRLLKFV